MPYAARRRTRLASADCRQKQDVLGERLYRRGGVVDPNEFERREGPIERRHRRRRDFRSRRRKIWIAAMLIGLVLLVSAMVIDILLLSR